MSQTVGVNKGRHEQLPFDAWRSCAVAADVAAASHAHGEALAARQRRRLSELLAAAARGSRLYGDILRGLDTSALPLARLPIMHKSELMGRFDDWVTDPDLHLDALQAFTADAARIGDPFLGRYTVWESSGSSGEPGIFVQDPAAMAVYDALEALRRPVLRPLQQWLDPWGWQQRSAFVGAIDGHFASIVSIERLRRLNPVLGARMHGLSFLQPLGELVAQLNALAPSVLATYPTAAVVLAEERLAGRLTIDLREVWTGGESLSPAMRRFVQDAFGCPVADSYGASEFLSLASECRSGGLHLNSDWVILEPVDDRGRPVPPGVPGCTTLLTNLANHVQPLIRYDLGDRVTLHAQRCACGSHLPRIDVEGRADDMLRLQAADGRTVRVLPLALSTVLEDQAGLFDFQLVQQGPRELLLRTGMGGAAARSTMRHARATLCTFLASQGLAGMRVHCRCDEPGQCGRSGKVRRIVSAMPCAGRVAESVRHQHRHRH